MLVRAFESIFIIYIAITRTCNVSKMTLSDPSWWILNLKINAKSNSGKILELLTVPKFFKKGSVDISWKLPVRILYKNILIEEKNIEFSYKMYLSCLYPSLFQEKTNRFNSCRSNYSMKKWLYLCSLLCIRKTVPG